MKKLLSFILILVSTQLKSQSILDSIAMPGFDLTDKIAYELANFAEAHQRVKIANNDVKFYQQELQKIKMSWMNNFNASYNFSLSVPLGFLYTKRKENELAKVNYQKSIDVKDFEIQQLRDLVIQEYQIFISNKYLLQIHQLALQDERIILDKATQMFESNQIDIEAYTVYSRKYNEYLTKKIELLRDLSGSRLRIETLIGMDLETALKKISSNQKN
jgi:hypothetical protein